MAQKKTAKKKGAKKKKARRTAQQQFEDNLRQLERRLPDPLAGGVKELRKNVKDWQRQIEKARKEREDRWQRLENQIRREYGWVPGFVFRRKRRKILEMLLGRDTLYSTETFVDKYEARARANLERGLDALRHQQRQSTEATAQP